MCVTSPAPREVWSELVERDPFVFPYQTPLGMDAICAAYDAEDASRLYDFSDGRKLVLPLFHRRRLPLQLTMEESPLVGSLVSPGPASRQELQAIFSDLADRPSLRTLVRPGALAAEAWADAAPAGLPSVQCRSHVLELGGGFESVWNDRFNGQARRAIRKAEKADIEVECDSASRLLAEFHDLLLLSVDRWAQRRHEPLFIARWRFRRREPIEVMRRMFETLGNACQIWLARVNGQPAAAIVVLFGSNAHYTRGAMNIELAGPTRASFLLQKLAIERACEAGCRYYNMGQTGSSETLARFKNHFGAEPYTHKEYRFERLPFTAVEAPLRGLIKRLPGRP